MDKNTFITKVLESESTLYHMSKTILFNDKDCEDVVQETILKAYEKIETLRQEAYFKTWLIRILINECYKFKRSKHPTVEYEEYFETSKAEEKPSYDDLYVAISHLPQKIRITVVLFYIEGYTINEIKKILKIPSGTVKSRLAKGRKLLKNELERNERIYEQL